jgi:hypothetical protein
MAKKDKDPAAQKKADKSGKADKKDKKGKKGKAGAEGGASIAGHPRARASIRRAKGWAGMVGFAVAAYVSIQASVPLFDVGLRALGAGVIGYMLAWWVGVLIWRQLILAEHRAAYELIERRRQETATGADGEVPRAVEAQVTG